MRAKHQNTLNVAGPAGAADEREKARKFVSEFFPHTLQSGGQIRLHLISPRQHNVMRRQHRQGAPARAGRRYQHAAGLCHQGFAFRQRRVAAFQIIHGISVIGLHFCQSQFPRHGIREFPAMPADFFPTTGRREFFHVLNCLAHICARAKFRLQGFCVLAEQIKLFLQRRAGRRQPFLWSSNEWSRRRVVMQSRMRCGDFQRLANPAQNNFAIGHGAFLSCHVSRKLFVANRGNERVFVHARNGSKIVPRTKCCRGCAMRPNRAAN